MTKNYHDPSNAYGSKLYELLHTTGGVPTDYTYTSNRLTSSSGGHSLSYTYNTDGDATYTNDAGLEFDLPYDRLHKLTSFNNHGGTAVAQFSYDGDGMRVVKTSAEGTTVYHYDAGGRVISETDSNGNLISDLVYANGKLVAKLLPATLYFYHTDPAGTPLAMTDPGGGVVWRADYLPFGEENIISGTLENDFRFVGKENDKETGLYYFGARYMEAMIGRFISPDAVGPVDPQTGSINGKNIFNPQRLNSYAYGLNNPYKYKDPDGNQDMMVEDPGHMQARRLLNKIFKEGPGSILGELRRGAGAIGADQPNPEATKKITDSFKTAEEIAKMTNWGRSETLKQHYRDHGADFGAKSEEDYAKQASDFHVRGRTEGLPTKIDEKGIVRIYDEKSNTFGSYNPDGSTRTFFKPKDGQKYWEKQPGR
jgi:RHS repeat-associated protein